MRGAAGRSDVRAGLMFVLFGALALGLGPAEKGTATEMAAGYLPALLGVLLIAVGLLLAAHGVRAVRLSRAPRSAHPGGASDPGQAVQLERAPASEQAMRPERAPDSARAAHVDDAPAAASRLERLRPFLILPAIVAFALMLERLGLVIASVALLVMGALAARDLTVRQFAVLAIGLLVLVLVVFVWGLGLPVKVWPSGTGG